MFNEFCGFQTKNKLCCKHFVLKKCQRWHVTHVFFEMYQPLVGGWRLMCSFGPQVIYSIPSDAKMSSESKHQHPQPTNYWLGCIHSWSVYTMGPKKPTCWEVFMVNIYILVFRWPKPLLFMVLGEWYIFLEVLGNHFSLIGWFRNHHYHYFRRGFMYHHPKGTTITFSSRVYI